MKILQIKHVNDYDACTFLNFYKNDLELIKEKYKNYSYGNYEEDIDGEEIEFEVCKVNMDIEALEFCRSFIDTHHVDLIKIGE